jgi:hypothetical protein
MTVLLGKIMAQVLLILALATKAMKERQIGEPVHWIYIFFAHDELETFLKRLVGRMNVEDALLRLDTLTKEESLMTAARNLQITHRIDHGATCPFFFIHFSNLFIPFHAPRTALSHEKLRSWLSPPNPSINHNIASATHHDGTASWFIQGKTFRAWKKNGSILWIRGNRTLIDYL